LAKNLASISKRIQKRAQNRGSYASALVTGVFAGVMMVIMTVTYASLIFSGPLHAFVGNGIALGLTSVVVVGTLSTILSASSHLIVQLDDDTAPVFALLLSLLAASLPITLSEADFFTNILAALFAATFISGSALAILGMFKFGNFVQFLPYSVMGGYFAAVGWLILLGAISMLTGMEIFSVDDFLVLISPDMLTLWVPAVLLGIFSSIMASRFKVGPLLAITVLVATLSFYGIHALLGNSPAQLMDSGQLIGPFDLQGQSLMHPITNLNWSAVAWQNTLGTGGSIASITLIGLLSMTLCISGLSLTTRKDLDVNHELEVAGLANMASGFLGGMTALPSLSISNLTYDVHPAASRLIGFAAVAIGLGTFYYGMPILAHIPKMILGGLSIHIGIGFVKEWLIDGYQKFGALEYSVIPIIMVVSILAGFLQGVLIGIVAAIILFVIKYSRIRIIRYQASGADLRSNLVRGAEQNALLKVLGEKIEVFSLQGYLFFGTTGSLYNAVLDSIESPQNQNLKYLILDFSQVIGVDSSATLNFEKLAQRLSERQIYLITTSLKQEVLDILRRGGLNSDNNTYLIQHVDLDQGMEWCENDILDQENSAEHISRGIFERIAEDIHDSMQVSRLNTYLERVDVQENQILIDLNQQSDEVFFLETCTASAYILDAQNVERRISGAGRGAIYGEIGFFLGIPRTAIVRADTQGQMYSLNRTSLARMEREEPELASAITRYLAQTVSERLVNTTQLLRSIL
jgi:SulP family sulfate permease